MTTQEKIEAIRAACITANPAIVELKFGCHFLWKENMRDYEEDAQPAVFENWRNKTGTVGLGTIRALTILGQQGIIEESHITKILGRPIRLDDTRQIIRQEYWGELIEIWRDGLLSDQPEVVIEWIVKNIAPLD